MFSVRPLNFTSPGIKGRCLILLSAVPFKDRAVIILYDFIKEFDEDGMAGI